MPGPIKFFSGSYPELATRLGFKEICLRENEGKERYRAKARVDAHRMSWFSGQFNLEEIERQFIEPLSLDQSDAPHYSYTQGDFDGRVFSDTQVTSSDIYQQHITSVVDGSHSTSFSSKLSVAYINDEGRACGFTLAYVRDDRDKSIPEKQRKRLYSATIIEDASEAPADRKVLFFTHPDLHIELFPDAMTNLTDEVDAAQVPDMIKAGLKSGLLSDCIDGLFDGDSISVDQFSLVKSWFPTGLNMDNRDSKSAMLNKLGQLAGDSSRELLSNLQQQARTDSSFFHGDQFANNIKRVYESMSEQASSDEKKKIQLTYQLIRLRLFLDATWIKDNEEPRRALDNYMKELDAILENRQLNIEEKTVAIDSRLASMKLEFLRLYGEERRKITAKYAEKARDLKKPETADPVKKPERLEIPFKSRNFYPLLVGGLALVALLGLVLTFSGVFAPVGLILTGTSLTLAVTAAAFTLGVLLVAGLMIIYNEIQDVKAEKKHRDELVAYDLCPFHRLEDEKALKLKDLRQSVSQFNAITGDFPAVEKPSLTLIEPQPHFASVLTPPGSPSPSARRQSSLELVSGESDDDDHHPSSSSSPSN